MSVRTRLKAAFNAMRHPTSGPRWGAILTGTNYDYSGKVGDGQDASVLMAPVMWIAKNAVQAPPEVLKLEKGQFVNQENHELARLLHRPNAGYTGKQLTMGTIICLLTSVDAYWIKVRDNRGKVAELWLAPSQYVTPMTRPGNSSSSFIDYYRYAPGGVPSEIAPEDMVHFRIGLNPRDVRHGMSPIYPLLREIFTDIEAANFTGALLRNMGIPGVIISPKDKDVQVDPNDAKDIKAKFEATFKGDKRGASMVNTVPVNIDQFGFNPDEMTLGKLRDIPEERVCAMLGVAASVVGFGTGLQQTKVGATAAEARRSSWEDGITPNLEIIADTLVDDMVPEFTTDPLNYTVRHNLSGIRALRESQDALFKRAGAGVNMGYLRVDQAQAMTGQDPDPTQRIYLRRSNMIEVPAGAPPKKQAEIGGIKSRPTPLQAQLMARYTRDEAKLAKTFESEVTEFLEEASGIVADIAQDILEGKSIAEHQLIVESVVLDDMERQLKGLFGSHYQRTGEATLSALNDVMGIVIGSPDLVAQRIIYEGGRRAGLVDLTATVKRRLFRILKEAEADGAGVPDIVRRIRHEVSAGPWSSQKIRARVIARTETINAQRESALEFYKQMEDVTDVMVFDARLGDSDEECIGLDGTIVTIAEAEVLSAEEHPNGTRNYAPVI